MRSAAQLEVSAYRSERDSLIYFIQNSQRNFVAKNLEGAVAKGIETSLELRIGGDLRARGAFHVSGGEAPGRRAPLGGVVASVCVAPRILRGGLVEPREDRSSLRVALVRFVFRDRANTIADRGDASGYHGAGSARLLLRRADHPRPGRLEHRRQQNQRHVRVPDARTDGLYDDDDRTIRKP